RSVALATAEALEADPVHGGDVAAVGDRLAAVGRAPGIELLGPVARLFLRVPADRRRVEQHVGALERREARAFGIPLVPAHERPDPSHARVERAKAQVAGSEIELLVVGRIVVYVHLAVGTHHATVGVYYRGAVVVDIRVTSHEHYLLS